MNETQVQVGDVTFVVAPEPKVRTPEDVMRRYPRLTAHLICQSLGYFNPRAEAGAILCWSKREPYWCELYIHYARGGKSMLDVLREDLERAISMRDSHHGFMADYGY